MNRRSPGSLPISKTILGFLQYKAAEGLSPHTLASYDHDLKLWLEYTGDLAIDKITSQSLQVYFLWLRNDYKSRQITGQPRPLAPKTIHNFYVSLSAFFTWASRELAIAHPLNAEFPAVAARALGWKDVALLCTHEMNVPHGLPRCIRILIRWNTSVPADQVRHVYLRQAVNLRLDRS